MTAVGLPTPINVGVLTSRASVSCNGTTPVLSGSSEVVGLTIAGQPVISTTRRLTIPLGILGSIKINHTTTNGKLVQRALWIDLIGEALDIVVGRSSANYEDYPCL